MDFLKTYLTKRYFLYFLLMFVLWYPGSFFMYAGYEATRTSVFFVALNVYYPLLMFLFSYVYFLKSPNDWNDRFFVGFGWIAISFLLAALLVRPVYGLPWDTVLNVQQIMMNWPALLAVIVSGLFAKTFPLKNRA